jgi:hypothetical protein
MPEHRMNRGEFFAKLADLDEEGVRKTLWNLYWRGSADIRKRIEAQIDPKAHARRQRAEETVDPTTVLNEIREFVNLARKGAYLAGDRRVSPKERTRWRFTFKRLAADAQAALRTEEVDAGATAIELLIDLACETKGYDRFRSDDPMQAAGFVVSDAVALLWTRLRDHQGFATFAERAAPQLVRWESAYGWTRYGSGKVVEKERKLSDVLAEMLVAQDMWIAFTECYVDALEETAARDSARAKRRNWRDPEWERRRRGRDLAHWHDLLLERLVHSEADCLLDRIAEHPALSGPDLTFFQARLAHERDDLHQARQLARDALEELPGDLGLREFAIAIDVPLPARISGRR